MHLLLTDDLVCPRCGPPFGLILLADRLEGRRVVEGALGCPNCRDRYPIHGGVGDLRPPPRSRVATESVGERRPGALTGDRAVAVAAAMGLAAVERARVLLLGAIGGEVDALAAVVPDEVEVVAAVRAALAPSPSSEARDAGSPLLVGDVLPFAPGSIQGVALLGCDTARPRLREAARVLAPGHRVVIVDPPDDAQIRLGGVGLTRFVRGTGIVAAGR